MSAAARAKKDTVEAYDRVGRARGLRCRIRNLIFDPEQIVPYIPERGDVLDIGCGDGFIVNYLSRLRPSSTIIGMDIAPQKLETARAAATGANVAFHDSVEHGNFAAVLCIDVLHHVPPAQQEQFVIAAARRIEKGGTLLIKDIDAGDRMGNAINQLHDLIWSREWAHARPRAAWRAIVERAGLVIRHEAECHALGYPHFLLVAQAGA